MSARPGITNLPRASMINPAGPAPVEAVPGAICPTDAMREPLITMTAFGIGAPVGLISVAPMIVTPFASWARGTAVSAASSSSSGRSGRMASDSSLMTLAPS